MFGSKYLLLELDKAEADFYHLPIFVPYLKKDQQKLKDRGFEWELAVLAMQQLVKEMDAEEYKPYKLFIRKWDYYKELSNEIKQENWREAEKIIDKILSIDLLDPSAYLNLGFIFRQIKEFHKAEQSYFKGLELLPDNVPFLAGLARAYEESQDIDKAIYTWKRLLDLAGGEDLEIMATLVKHKVYKRVEKRDPVTKKKSFEYTPAEKFEDLMKMEFDAKYDDVEALTNLGLQLIQESYTKFAIQVFGRVHQLSQAKSTIKEIPKHLKM